MTRLEIPSDAARLRTAMTSVVLALTVGLSACAGGDDTPAPVGTSTNAGGDISTGDSGQSFSTLEATWGGTLEQVVDEFGNTQLAQLEVEFGASNQITRIAFAGSDSGMTATLQGSPQTTPSGFLQHFYLGSDGGEFVILTNADRTHGAVLTGNEDVAVLQRGATTGSFTSTGAAGAWAGEGYFSGVRDGGTDPFDFRYGTLAGTYEDQSGIVSSSDITFTDPQGDTCNNISVDLGAAETAFGTYQQGQVLASGTGQECPSGDANFDALMSYDQNFMVVGFGGGEPGSGCFVIDDACAMFLMVRQ